MPPHDGLVHLKEYDIKESNVEFIGSDIDHRVKYASAASEPAWNNGVIGQEAGLFVWRIEDFQVIPWPTQKHGQFFSGDSYIVLSSILVGKNENQRLVHDIFFWLGRYTSQDEAGTAAYKTVELDEFLHGKAAQHRELQDAPSPEFLALFPKITILRGGVESGFTDVASEQEREAAREAERKPTVLRVFKPDGGSGVMVYEVEPRAESLDEGDVFIVVVQEKIWVWQGKGCSPMEKAKAAQVVHDMVLEEHKDVEVVSQNESRSAVVVKLLSGEAGGEAGYKAKRPVRSAGDGRPKRMFRLSDASGQLSFDMVTEGDGISKRDLDSDDVFLLDTGKTVWVWEGQGASHAERKAWLRVAQSYVGRLQESPGSAEDAYLTSYSKVVEGSESQAFLKELGVWVAE